MKLLLTTATAGLCEEAEPEPLCTWISLIVGAHCTPALTESRPTRSLEEVYALSRLALASAPCRRACRPGCRSRGEADELRVDFQTTLVLRLGVRSLAAGLVVVVVRERGLGERVGLAVPLRRRGGGVAEHVVHEVDGVLEDLVVEVDALGGVEHEQVGGVGAGLALAGQRGLGRDVDDRALRFAQVRGAAVGELVIVREVAVQRLLEFAPRGVVEVEVVVAGPRC